MTNKHIRKDSIKLLKEGEITPTGQHFTVPWEIFEDLLRGTGLPLLGPNEHIITVKEVSDRGISICIGDNS